MDVKANKHNFFKLGFGQVRLYCKIQFLIKHIAELTDDQVLAINCSGKYVTTSNKLAELLSTYGAKRESTVTNTPPNMGLLGILDGLNEPVVLKDLWFKGKEVKVDGYSFVSCRFDGCLLSISSSNFSFSHCVIDEGCTLQYGADMPRIIQLFNMHFTAPGPLHEPFYPQRHADGTISIGF